MNAPSAISMDRREISDRYRGEIIRSGKWRIVICKDSYQWILQRLTRSESPDGVRWEGRHYFRQRDTAIRLWRKHTGEDGAILMALLPERFSTLK
ncbi:MAG: hypothetical protein WBB85_22330 [Albidovulum sp.]|uniref:hypothetical protein n=1 Tax=Albidovulum sp. TaxID=1872424 RepID=UPI003C8818D4